VRSIFRSMLNYPFQLIRRLLNPPHSPYTPLFRSAVTAAAGMDILCHALESYTATPYDAGPRKQPHERVPYCGANPIADMWAERSDRKSTRLNSSHVKISYAVFLLKKKKDYITVD